MCSPSPLQSGIAAHQLSQAVWVGSVLIQFCAVCRLDSAPGHSSTILDVADGASLRAGPFPCECFSPGTLFCRIPFNIPKAVLASNSFRAFCVSCFLFVYFLNWNCLYFSIIFEDCFH